MNTLLLLENAAKQVLRQAALQTISKDNIYSSQDSPDGGWEGSETIRKLPTVICQVESAESVAPRSLPSHLAPKRCRLRTIVRSQRDDESDADHRARCDEVFAYVLSPAFRAALNNSRNLTILLALDRGPGESQAQRHLESHWDQDIDCVPATIIG